jgi:hypothetical protein
LCNAGAGQFTILYNSMLVSQQIRRAIEKKLQQHTIKITRFAFLARNAVKLLSGNTAVFAKSKNLTIFNKYPK